MSNLPRFFFEKTMAEKSIVSLDDDTAKHIWQVLRMQADDELILTDGKGSVAEGIIRTAERHKCTVVINKVTTYPRLQNVLHLCVGFTKNNSRNEWLLEKATELGVASIVPIAASRTEKLHIRGDRWQKILQSAVLQSRQNYLPHFADITPLETALAQYSKVPQKLVAHCMDDAAKRPLAEMLNKPQETVLFIGPEGDFTKDEVNLCSTHGFIPVSLGTQRLRTETAAIAAAAYFNMFRDA